MKYIALRVITWSGDDFYRLEGQSSIDGNWKSIANYNSKEVAIQEALNYRRNNLSKDAIIWDSTIYGSVGINEEGDYVKRYKTEYNTWQLISNYDGHIIAEKTYSKNKTINQLRSYAVSYVVNHDLARWGFHINYI